MTSRRHKRPTRKTRGRRLTPAMVVGDGLLLLLSLVGVVLFCLFTYQVETALLPLLRRCGLFSLLWLAIFSLPRYRYRLPAMALVLLVAGVLLWRDWPQIVAGGQEIYAVTAQLLTDAMNYPGYYTAQTGLTAVARRAAITRCMTAGVFALSFLLGWAVVRLRRWWVVFLLTFPWLLPAFLAEIWLSWFSFGLLAVCWMTMLLSSAGRRSDPAGRARLTLIALPVSAAALILLALLFPRTDYTQPAWALAAQGRLNGLGDQVLEELPGDGSGNSSAASEEVDGVDLTTAGPRYYTGQTVLLVEGADPGPLYLRGASAAYYTGTSWETLNEDEPDTSLPSAYFPALGVTGGEERTLTVSSPDGPLTIAYYPYHPTSVPSSADQTQGAAALIQGECVEDSYLPAPGDGLSYTVRYLPIGEGLFSTVDAGFRGAEQSYRDFVYEHYLDVPAETAQTLCQWRTEAEEPISTSIYVSDAPAVEYLPVMNTVARVVRLLAATTQYDLRAPYTPAGADFVTYFLTESHRGYCVHYASAATLLLRLEGIPARYVSGYGAECTQSGTAAVLDSDAHAWVEVYLDGYGWYPVEVTPSGQGGGEEADPTQPEPSQSTPPEETPEPEETELPRDTGEETEEATPTPARGWIYVPATLLLIAGLAALLRQLRRLRWNRLRTIREHGKGVVDAYGYFLSLIPWGGKPGARSEELVRKARFSQHELTKQERAAVLTELTDELHRLDRTLTFPWFLLFHYWFVFDRPWRSRGGRRKRKP